MKKNPIYFLYITLLIAFFFNISYAETLISQSDYSSTMTLSNAPRGYNVTQYLNNNDPLGVNGDVYSISVYTGNTEDRFQSIINVNGYGSYALNRCDNAFTTYQGCSGGNFTSVNPTSHSYNSGIVTLYFASPVALDSGKYYSIVTVWDNVAPTNPTEWYIGGSTNGSCYIETYSIQYGTWDLTCSATTLKNIFYSLNGSGGYVEPVYTTHFDSISVSTTTQTVNITGYWNATTTSGIYEQIEFYQNSTLLGIESYTTENATTTGTFNFDFDYNSLPSTSTSTTTPIITADTIFYANLYQIDTNYPYDPFTGIIDPRYKTTLDATSTTLTASTTLYTIDTTIDVINYPEYECSISSLTGCFKNAMVWTFYPSQETMSRFYALLEVIQSKPPIGYFSIIKGNLTSINASSTPAFNVTIPTHLKDYFFDPIDTALSVIIWAYFILMFYKRLKHIQI